MIKINILPASNPFAISTFAFPEVSQAAQDWVRQQLHEGTTYLTDAGAQFFHSAVSTYQNLVDGGAIRGARKLARMVSGMMHPNSIYAMTTYAELQAAKPVMQRYIMACPELRQLHQQQRCDGYADSYFDMTPKDIGDSHYEYRQVMSGMSQEDPDHPDEHRFVEYLQELYEGDEPLRVESRFDLIDTWDVARKGIFENVDVTNVFDSDLGL